MKAFYLSLIFLLTSCGSHVVIAPEGYLGSIEFAKTSKQFQLEEDLAQKKDLEMRKKGLSFLGPLASEKLKIARPIRYVNTPRRPINQFTITTTFSWFDSLINLAGILGSRSVIYRGQYCCDDDEDMESE